MNFTEDYCNTLIKSFNNDENVGQDMFHQLLNSYLNKYDNKIKPFDEIQVGFRNDTKLLFNVIINTLANKEEMMAAFDDNFDENNEVDVKEKQDYITFCDNVNGVLEQIDTVDLLHPDEEFTYNCKNAISYFYKKMEEANGLNNTMKNLSHTLNSLIDILPNMMNDIKTDTNESIEETKYYDYDSVE